MLKAGVDKRTLREYVGHQSDEIIDRYSHFIPENLEAKVNFGINFIQNGGNVVTIRSPKKKASEENACFPEAYDENPVGSTGLEPESPRKNADLAKRVQTIEKPQLSINSLKNKLKV